MTMPILYIVIPCYNEQGFFRLLHRYSYKKLMLCQEKGKISPDSRILFVNDGSKDDT